MVTTSTYAKHFFLPGENLTSTGKLNNTDTKKVFSLLKEDLNFKKANLAKKEIDMTRNVVWICPKCGHTHVGATAISSCPICNSDYEKN